MREFSRGFPAILTALAVLVLVPQREAVALDLMKDLPCAFTQTVHTEAG